MQKVRFVWKLHRLPAVLLMFIGMAPTAAQKTNLKPQTGDKSIEAVGYLTESDRDLQCNPESSKTWAKKALDTLSGVKKKDQETRNVVSSLKSESNSKISAAEGRSRQLSAAASQARVLFKRRRLESAQGTLTRLDPDACYARFKELRLQIDQRKSVATGFVDQGDEMVRDGNAAGAISARNARKYYGIARKLYAKARKIDVEYPDLDNKLPAKSGKRRRG